VAFGTAAVEELCALLQVERRGPLVDDHHVGIAAVAGGVHVLRFRAGKQEYQ
jgi:hypothetical protein